MIQQCRFVLACNHVAEWVFVLNCYFTITYISPKKGTRNHKLLLPDVLNTCEVPPIRYMSILTYTMPLSRRMRNIAHIVSLLKWWYSVVQNVHFYVNIFHGFIWTYPWQWQGEPHHMCHIWHMHKTGQYIVKVCQVSQSHALMLPKQISCQIRGSVKGSLF